jgi:hypothetical protein
MSNQSLNAEMSKNFKRSPHSPIYNLLFFAVSSIFILLTTGCDAIRGVWREREIYSLPDMKNLELYLNENPNIMGITHWDSEGGDAFSLSSFQMVPSDKYYTFNYYVKNFQERNNSNRWAVNLLFKEDRHRNKFFYLNSLTSFSRPPQELIDQAWPVMKEIEDMLINEFGLVELKEGVKVEIDGVEHPERNKESMPKRGG